MALESLSAYNMYLFNLLIANHILIKIKIKIKMVFLITISYYNYNLVQPYYGVIHLNGPQNDFFRFPNSVKPIKTKCKEHVMCCFGHYLWFLLILKESWRKCDDLVPERAF